MAVEDGWKTQKPQERQRSGNLGQDDELTEIRWTHERHEHHDNYEMYLIYDDHFSWKLDCQVNGKKQHPYSGAEGKTSPKDGSWKPIAFGKDCARTIHRFPAGGRWGFKRQLHYGANLKQWDGSWCAVNIRVSCPWRRSKIVVFTVASTLYFRLWVGDKKRVVKAAKHVIGQLLHCVLFSFKPHL